MKAQLNKPLAATLAGVIVLGMLVAAAAGWRMWENQPDRLLARGIAAVNDGDLPGAEALFDRSMQRGQHDPAFVLRFGDALNNLVAQDADFLDAARNAWASAAAMDVHDPLPLQRLLDSYTEQANLMPDGSTLTSLRNAAEQLAKLQPTEARWNTAWRIADIRLALAHDPTGKSATTSKAALAQLLQSGKIDTAKEADARYWLAEIDLARGDKASASAWFARATSTHPANAEIEWRAGQIYSAARRTSDAAECFTRMLASPMSGPDVPEMFLAAGQQLDAQGDIAAERELATQSIEKCRDSLPLRLGWADLLGDLTQTRSAAEAMLHDGLPTPAKAGALAIYEAGAVHQAVTRWWDMKLADAEANPSANADQLPMLESQLSSLNFEPLDRKLCEGRLRLLQHRMQEATECFSQADLLATTSAGSITSDQAYHIAAGFDAVGQTERARTLLGKTLDAAPQFYAGRETLVQWLIAAEDRDSAQQQAGILQSQCVDPGASGDAFLSAGRAMETIASSAEGPQAQAEAAKSRQLEVALLRQASARWPVDVEIASALADALRRSGDVAGGRAVLAALADQPGQSSDVEPMILLGQYLLHAGESADAQAELKSAAGRFAGDSDATRQIADLLVDCGDAGDAEALLGHFPANDSTDVHERIATLVALHQLDEAERLARLFAAKHSQIAQLDLVSVLLAEKNWNEARQAVDTVLAATPSDVPALYDRGLIDLRDPAGDIRQAVQLLKTAHELDSDRSDILLAIAEADQRQGQGEDAIAEADRALHLDPTDPAARVEEITLCEQQSPPQWGPAIALLHDAETMPELAGDPRWLRLEAEADLGRGLPADSVECYRKLASRHRPDIDDLNDLACVLTDNFDPTRAAEALPYAKAAVDQMQGSGRFSAAVADTYGWALVRAGKIDAGIAILAQAAKDTHLADPRLHLAETYLRRGEIDAASDQLKAARSLAERSTPPDLDLNKRIADASARLAAMRSGASAR